MGVIMGKRDDGFVFYRFDAYDPDFEMDCDCFIQLKYSPSSSSFESPSPTSMKTTIILGEFDAADVTQQAYDWFKGQYGVKIDQPSILEFLSMIQKYTHTSFIAVLFDINKTEFFSD